jgi:hypothetical protein
MQIFLLKRDDDLKKMVNVAQNWSNFLKSGHNWQVFSEKRPKVQRIKKTAMPKIVQIC